MSPEAVTNIPYVFGFVVGLAVFLFIFLICREIVCWYWKMNEVTETLTEIKDILVNLSNTPLLKDPSQDIGPSIKK